MIEDKKINITTGSILTTSDSEGNPCVLLTAEASQTGDDIFLGTFGGKVDPGENPLAGFLREFEEESGLLATAINLAKRESNLLMLDKKISLPQEAVRAIPLSSEKLLTIFAGEILETQSRLIYPTIENPFLALLPIPNIKNVINGMKLYDFSKIAEVISLPEANTRPDSRIHLIGTASLIISKKNKFPIKPINF